MRCINTQGQQGHGTPGKSLESVSQGVIRKENENSTEAQMHALRQVIYRFLRIFLANYTASYLHIL